MQWNNELYYVKCTKRLPLRVPPQWRGGQLQWQFSTFSSECVWHTVHCFYSGGSDKLAATTFFSYFSFRKNCDVCIACKLAEQQNCDFYFYLFIYFFNLFILSWTFALIFVTKPCFRFWRIHTTIHILKCLSTLF